MLTVINKPSAEKWWYLRLLAILSLAALQIVGLNKNHAVAQNNIVADDTLGNDKSRVVPFDGNNAIDTIRGGAVRGSNLFHSFQEFNIGSENAAYFYSPNAEIQNILARVTGRNPSEILGILGTRLFDGNSITGSNANLFLINPNGIIFGENARLDIGGSFVATTADGIQFGEQGFFSATNPEVPQLLTVNPSALFFNQVAAQAIVNRSISSLSSGSNFAVGLQVPNGKNLTLLGGKIDLDGGKITAFGGRVEVGAVKGIATVSLNPDGSLSYPETIERADIQLSNRAAIYVPLDEGGEIKITGKQIDITNSTLQAGILIGSKNSQAGNIEINASELSFRDISNISNNVFANTQGNSGNINLFVNSLLLDFSQITATTQGQGNSGKININAKEQISINNGNIRSNVATNASGNSGGIQINTNSISVTNGGQIQSDTAGIGNAGGVNILATNRVQLDGSNATNFVSRIRSDVAPGAIGNNGAVFIDAGSLLLTNGSRLSSSVWGKGESRDITIQAKENVLLNRGEIFSTLEDTGEGSAGNISVEAPSILLNNRSRVSSQTVGLGKAGDVTITASDQIEVDQRSLVSSRVANSGIGEGGNIQLQAKSILVANDSEVAANTFGKGNAGHVFVTAQDKVVVDGGGFFSNTGAWPDNINLNLANAGDINITTGSLFVTNGGQLVSANAGTGKAGNVNIIGRDDVRFDGVSDNGDTSLATTIVELRAKGDGGNINITAGRSVYVTNGAQLASDTRGRGNGGNIVINAEKDVVLDGGATFNFSLPGNQFTFNRPSLASSGTIGFGTGGDITINSDNLNISNSAEISAGGFSNKAGNITVNARSINLQNGNIETNLIFNGNGGNIKLSAKDIFLTRSSNINTTTGDGNSGNVTLEAKDIRLRNNSNIRTNSGDGSGGNINLTADTIIALDNSDILSFSADGKGGDINFKTAAFLSNPLYQPTPPIRDRQVLNQLNTNEQVDVNASGTVSGTIAGVPDITFIQNSLIELPENQIDTNILVANSCIVRSNSQNGTFFITGSGGLPQNPTDAPLSPFSTGNVQSIPITSDKSPASATQRPWKIGDPIIEPSGVYKLPNGQIVLSRECSK